MFIFMNKKNLTNSRCVVYARYSCSNQSEQSIEGQMHDCEKYAAQNGLRIIGTYIDRAMTATSDKRPQFQQMIKDSAKQTFDVVLVWKLDRFSRNRYDSAVYKSKLKKNGIRVVSVTENISDNPEGILMESILEGYAEYYSAELAQKVKRGMRETAAKGKITCAIPFGYRKSAAGTYEIDPNTAPAIKKIFEMYVNRERNIDIVLWLNNNGYKTMYGNPFNANSIYTIIQRKRYCGKYSYDGIEYTDESQRIISDELFDKAQVIKKINKHSGAVFNAHERYILSGKLFCGKCHSRLCGESGIGKNGTVYCYYKCPQRKKGKTCNKSSIRKEFIEDKVIKQIIEKALNETIINRIIDSIMLSQQNAPASKELAALNARKSDIEKRINNILNAVEQGIINSSTQDRFQELEQAKENITLEIQRYKLSNRPITAHELHSFFDELKPMDFSNLSDKLKLIELFIKRIYIWDKQLIIIYNFPGTPDNEIDFDNIINTVPNFVGTSSGGSP